ncbi:MAG: flagellar export chaperone FliS [Planctomycetaceae bacterium]
MQHGNEYLETRVMTATPQELHMMVIDGAIRFATQAEQAMQENDAETANEALNRSREFVIELISGLDKDRDDELIVQLRQLFGFVYRNLTEADLESDVQKIRDALKVLKIHRENWSELILKLKSEQTPAPKSSQPETRSWAS